MILYIYIYTPDAGQRVPDLGRGQDGPPLGPGEAARPAAACIVAVILSAPSPSSFLLSLLLLCPTLPPPPPLPYRHRCDCDWDGSVALRNEKNRCHRFFWSAKAFYQLLSSSFSSTVSPSVALLFQAGTLIWPLHPSH